MSASNEALLAFSRSRKKTFFNALFATICTAIIWFALPISKAFSQNNSPIPAFYPIAEHSYGIKEGLPDMYISQVLMDTLGRLHILKHGTGRTALASTLYQYDGKQAYPTSFNLQDNARKIRVGVEPSLRYYGSYQYETGNGQDIASDIFTYNPITGQSESIPIFNTTQAGTIVAVAPAEGALFVLTFHPYTQLYEISRVQDGNLTSVSQFKINPKLGILFNQLGVTSSDFWVSINSRSVFRINRKDGSVHTYTLSNETTWNAQYISSPQDELWIVMDDAVYAWNAITAGFIKNPYKPSTWKDSEIQYAGVFKDSKGNILFSYRNKNETPSATLKDTHGRFFDFSTVMKMHRAVTGSDFKQGLICFDKGLRFVEVASRAAILKNTEIKGCRGILELNEQTLFLNNLSRRKLFSFAQGNWTSQINTLSILDLAFLDGDLTADSKGNTWFNSKSSSNNPCRLMRFHPEEKSWDTFDPGLSINRFALINDQNLVLATNDSLYLWNLQNRIPKPLCRLHFKGGLNQMFVGRDGVLWVAGDGGLLKIDIPKRQQQSIELVKGQKVSVLRILQDVRGRLWLGTALHGLIIYDPGKGSTRVINQTSGLSNNTVVSLLEDNDGDIWVGTFCGITVLAQDGMVIGKLYEEDGLANNECNRWSALKMKDGRLVFGAVLGFTVINPALWKRPLEGYTPPRIFLTGLYNDNLDRSAARKDLLEKYEHKQRIVLPANNRNLKAVFVLSNYASPEKSIFAYHIGGENEEWQYIGTQRNLSLNALPAGNYDIRIKGTDGHGKWMAEPIVIPLTVEAFFYQKWWFFVLCALPFIAFFLLWQHQQRGERIRLEQEVQNRTATIREQNEKLLEVDNMKSTLYTNITHEFRTPLTVIAGMADMIQEQPAKSKELIKRNSNGLLRLVNQILDLAKLESGHLQLEMIQADIVPYARYLTESLQSFAATKNIHLEFHSDLEQLFMDFDEKKLEIIVSNLLSNAVKFSKAHDNITLTLQEENKQLVIKVKDTGIGMSPENQSLIFDRFYQVDNPNDTLKRSHKTGSGIGLTLTKELVELMEGTISVKSTLGQGTEFILNLPIQNKAPIIVLENELQVKLQDIPAEKASNQAFTTHPTGTEAPLQLLLIEDNEDVAAYIQACLQNLYQIEWAENGAIGIEKALELIPDAIISDVMMPEKDGFEVCQTLKNDERTDHIPIILLTAKIDVASRMEGLGVGADAYLAKPFLKEELMLRLKNLVELRLKLQEKYAGSDFSPKMLGDRPTPEAIFLTKASQYIRDRINDPHFGNDVLCQLMTMSESQLNRKLKAITGRTLALFIRDVRLQEGKVLLQTTDLNISEIAFAVGFSSPAYFTRSFSQKFGAAPSSFRDQS